MLNHTTSQQDRQITPIGANAGADIPADESDVVAAIDALTGGDYAHVPQAGGAVADSVRRLATRLAGHGRDLLDRTVANSMQTSEAMASVCFVTGDVREIDDSTHGISSAVEEMTATIAEISEASTVAADLTRTAQESVAAGSTAVGQSVDSMAELAEGVAAAAEKAESLSGASEQIGDILQVIETIAKQTNLLALNATIEAARAGDAGKGFAVVAGEVKTLANQTAKATEDIRQQVSSIRTVMDEILGSMTAVAEAVTRGQADIAGVGERIGVVVGEIDAVLERVQNTASSVSEQTAAMEEISRAAAAIVAMTVRARDNAERAIEAVGSAEGMINAQFQELDGFSLPHAILFRAKSDHFLWKKNLADILVGRSDKTSAALTSHHECRLGKWYGSVSDPAYLNHPIYRALEEPHRRVHEHGKKAADLFLSGDREGAGREYQEVERASREVVSLLDEMIGSFVE